MRGLILLLCLSLLPTALAEPPERWRVLESGESATAIYVPAHRRPQALLKGLRVDGLEVTALDERLVLRGPKAAIDQARLLLTALDTRRAETLILLRIEELLEATAGDARARTRVIDRRRAQLRLAIGEQGALELGGDNEGAPRHKLALTPTVAGADGVSLTIRYEVNLPAAAGPSAEEGPGKGLLRRQGELTARVAAAAQTTLIEVDLGREELGLRRVFRISARALVGEAARALPDWERRLQVRKIILDEPPVALIELDGTVYRLRAGARLGPLQVISIEDDVTFRVGERQFSLTPRGD